MADHTEFVVLAQELILEEGRLVTFQKLGAGPADANKPWKGAGAPTVVSQVASVPAVFVPATGSDLGRMVTDEELLKRVEQVALVAPVQEGFDSFHRILDTDSQLWKIEWMQVLKPASQTILYVVGVKR